MKLPTREQLDDAMKFSNFAQKMKMLIWSKVISKDRDLPLFEKDLDSIALELWEYLKVNR